MKININCPQYASFNLHNTPYWRLKGRLTKVNNETIGGRGLRKAGQRGSMRTRTGLRVARIACLSEPGKIGSVFFVSEAIMALEAMDSPRQDLDARVEDIVERALERCLPTVLARMGEANPRDPGSGGGKLLQSLHFLPVKG